MQVVGTARRRSDTAPWEGADDGCTNRNSDAFD